MTLVPIPTALRIREESWQQTDPRLVQRAEFGGSDREIITGPVARWTCTAEIVTSTADDMLALRQFLARMAMPGAFAAVPIHAEGGQQTGLPGAASSAAVDGSGQLGSALALRGLTPSIINLRAGHAIEYGEGRGHAVSILREDLVANGSGVATAQLSAPIRRSPADGTAVVLAAPVVWMRLANPLAWSNRLARLHNLPPLTFEETF